jgi:glycosyltransferase involved in cell wall biosynthesis
MARTSRDVSEGAGSVDDTTAPATRPVVIASECPWPARNGVTAKSAGLIDGWDVPALVICPDHDFGPRSLHLAAPARAPRRVARLSRLARVASAAGRRGWVVQPGLEPERVVPQLRRVLTTCTPLFVHFDTVATAHLMTPVASALRESGVRVPVVLSINDSISELLRTRPRRTGLLGRLDVRMMKAAERRAYPLADAVDVVTPGDVGSVLEVAPSAQVRLIPLGASLASLPADELDGDRPIDVLLFATAGDWPMLTADFLPALRARAPRARVAAVGEAGLGPDVIDRLDAHGVERLGFVDDLAATLRQARVVLAPSQQRAGTPNKARDGLANGAAVVGGACLHGLPGFTEPEHGLVAASGVLMAEAVHQLLIDEDRRARLARQGHALVTQLPDWSTIARRYISQLPAVKGAPHA